VARVVATALDDPGKLSEVGAHPVGELHRALDRGASLLALQRPRVHRICSTAQEKEQSWGCGSESSETTARLLLLQ
jgi:hypothetical protein